MDGLIYHHLHHLPPILFVYTIQVQNTGARLANQVQATLLHQAQQTLLRWAQQPLLRQAQQALPNWPNICVQQPMIFEPITGCVNHFYIVLTNFF